MHSFSLVSAIAVLAVTASAAPLPDDGQYHPQGDLGLYTWKGAAPAAATPAAVTPTPVAAAPEEPKKTPTTTPTPVHKPTTLSTSTKPATTTSAAPVAKNQQVAVNDDGLSKADLLAKCQIVPPEAWEKLGLDCNPNDALPNPTVKKNKPTKTATTTATPTKDLGGAYSQMYNPCPLFTSDQIIAWGLDCPLRKRDVEAAAEPEIHGDDGAASASAMTNFEFLKDYGIWKRELKPFTHKMVLNNFNWLSDWGIWKREALQPFVHKMRLSNFDWLADWGLKKRSVRPGQHRGGSPPSAMASFEFLHDWGF